tara:strand:- start:315 stop:488 length:174 start_codon:yes stop_codon:yes gene_type:complete
MKPTEEQLEEARQEYMDLFSSHPLSIEWELTFEQYLIISLNMVRDSYADLKLQMEEQ